MDRVHKASIATNIEPPVLRGQKKDHRNVTPVPLRPVCGVTEAPNARLSHMLSLILDMIADSVPEHHECRSSENMRAGFEDYNKNTSDEDKKDAIVLSMDVKSLYPSITKAIAKKAIEDILLNTDLTILNINWWEAVKYVFVTVSRQEISDKGLSDVTPSCVKKAPRLNVNCLQNNEDDDSKWLRASRLPDENEKKKILGLVLATLVDFVMSNHVYKVGDNIHLQTDGGPMGLKLTGAIARVVMILFDKIYLEKVEQNGMKMLLYERYVGDSNQIAKKVNENDSDEETCAKLKDIANECLDNIIMEDDLPSRHPDSRLPILDMKVWLDTSGNAVYTHYEKPTASTQIISIRSAHSGSCKRAVHVNELVRRMSNVSPRLSWDEYMVPVLEEYMRRMAWAGYGKVYRHGVLKKAVSIYEGKLCADREGTVPLNRGKKRRLDC